MLALEKDENYWLAAWLCADAYYQEKNWGSARHYYYKALRSGIAQKIPDIHFYLAWCLSKLNDYQGEERYYRSCLELDPDYPYARNNLGWSLYRQGRFQEALEVFEEAIRRGNDGKYPLRNKVRTLVKLGRLPEAIKNLGQDTYRGKLTKFAQDEITRLRGLIVKQQRGEALSAEAIEEVEEEGVVVEDAHKEPPESFTDERPIEPKHRIKHGGMPSRFQRERWLESTLEEMICKGLPVLGRQFRMYDHSEKGYGRQLAIARVGIVDLLVEDIETNDLLVIELKRDRSDDQVIGQISSYMTWVRENLAQRGQKVLGIVCLYSASDRLRLSARNIPGVEVFEYGLTFKKVS